MKPENITSIETNDKYIVIDGVVHKERTSVVKVSLKLTKEQFEADPKYAGIEVQEA